MIQSVSFGRPPYMPDDPNRIRRHVSKSVLERGVSASQLAQEIENAKITGNDGPHIDGLRDALNAKLSSGSNRHRNGWFAS